VVPLAQRSRRARPTTVHQTLTLMLAQALLMPLAVPALAPTPMHSSIQSCISAAPYADALRVCCRFPIAGRCGSRPSCQQPAAARLCTWLTTTLHCQPPTQPPNTVSHLMQLQCAACRQQSHGHLKPLGTAARHLLSPSARQLLPPATFRRASPLYQKVRPRLCLCWVPASFLHMRLGRKR
jgi:hypothetical protein